MQFILLKIRQPCGASAGHGKQTPACHRRRLPPNDRPECRAAPLCKAKNIQ